jgi:hypothetical protein
MKSARETARCSAIAHSEVCQPSACGLTLLSSWLVVLAVAKPCYVVPAPLAALLVACSLQVAIFMGKTDPTAPTHKQQSMLLVPMEAPGVNVIRPLSVFGYDDAPHGHAEVIGDNYCAVSNVRSGHGCAAALLLAVHSLLIDATAEACQVRVVIFVLV